MLQEKLRENATHLCSVIYDQRKMIKRWKYFTFNLKQFNNTSKRYVIDIFEITKYIVSRKQ